MKVFLSWSGELSRAVAIVLREWLPSVIQSVEPYVSSEDIDKGARWSTDIAKELESSSFGILCVTPENLEAAWLHFEAGALSKTVDKARVCPFLVGVKRSEIQGPLLQFQSSLYEKEDVKKLIFSINSAHAEGKLEEQRLESIFEVWWPKLEERLSELEARATELAAQDAPEPRQATGDVASSAILEEILELARAQQRLLRAPEELLPPEYLANVVRHSPLLGTIPAEHPVWDELRSTAAQLRVCLEDCDLRNEPLEPTFGKLIQSILGCVEYIETRGRRVARIRKPPV